VWIVLEAGLLVWRGRGEQRVREGVEAGSDFAPLV
jgi:hypothetical protein